MSDAVYARILAAIGETGSGMGSEPLGVWNHYEVLGLTASATQQDVKKAYKQLALRFHPDKALPQERQRSETIFRVVAKAYSTLVDPKRRLEYDSGQGESFEDSEGSPFEIFARTFFETRHKTDSDTRSAEWTLSDLANYQVYSPDEAPEHLKAIVQTGLNYLAKVLDLESQSVVLLRHLRIDILWVILAFDASKELNQERFAEDGYPITYYDNPLQSGISPSWSDQNVLNVGSRRDPALAEAKELSLDDFIERRELARLEQEALEQEERRALCGG